MRAFVTGGSGFVGGWLTAHLEQSGDVVCAPGPELDVLDGAALTDAVVEAAPDVVYHLAALTHVGQSWVDPDVTFQVNAVGTLHLLEAAARCPVPPGVVLVSSAEVYGPAPDGEPLGEESPLRPFSPYAASKVAAEYLGLQAHLGQGLRVVRARPFNHIGPGQSDAFVVAALARRMVEAEASGATSVAVGNLTAARDFTDVRDVVRAYRALATAGASGEAYNICTGRAVTVRELADLMRSLFATDLRLEQDPALVRPVDVPVLLGDPAKLEALCGWRPVYDLAATVRDVLDDWRRRLATTGVA